MVSISFVFSVLILFSAIFKSSLGIECFYCGVKDLCELPFDEDTVEKIECPASCLKFDGFSEDGQKVTVRDCGFFDADECTVDHTYEDTSAVGSLCHCRDGLCNEASWFSSSSLVTFIVTMVAVLINGR